MNKFDVKLNADVYSAQPIQVTPTPSATTPPPSPSPVAVTGDYNAIVTEKQPTYFWRFPVGATDTYDIIDGSVQIQSSTTFNDYYSDPFISGGVDFGGMISSVATFGYFYGGGQYEYGISSYSVEFVFAVHQTPDQNYASAVRNESDIFGWSHLDAADIIYSLVVKRRFLDGGWSEASEYDLYLLTRNTSNNSLTETLILSEVPLNVLNHAYVTSDGSTIQIYVNSILVYNQSSAPLSDFILRYLGSDSDKTFSVNIDAVAFRRDGVSALDSSDLEKRLFYIRNYGAAPNLVPTPTPTTSPVFPTPTPSPTQGLDFNFYSAALTADAVTHRWLMDDLNPVDVASGNNLSLIYDSLQSDKTPTVAPEGLNGSSVDITITYPQNYNVAVGFSLDTPVNLANFSNGATLACWLRFRQPPTGEDFYGSIFGTSGGNAEVAVFSDTTGNYDNLNQIWLGIYDDYYGNYYEAPLGVGYGQWLYLAVTLDTNDNLVAYVNGQPIMNASAYLLENWIISYIGTDNWNDNFDGNIEDVAIYNSVLTQSALEYHYTIGSAIFPPAPTPTMTPTPSPSMVVATQPTPTPTPTPSYAPSVLSPSITMGYDNISYVEGDYGEIRDSGNVALAEFYRAAIVPEPFDGNHTLLLSSYGGGGLSLYGNAEVSFTLDTSFSYQFLAKIQHSFGSMHTFNFCGFDTNGADHTLGIFRLSDSVTVISHSIYDYQTDEETQIIYDVTGIVGNGTSIFVTCVFDYDENNNTNRFSLYLNGSKVYLESVQPITVLQEGVLVSYVYPSFNTSQVPLGDKCLVGRVYQYNTALSGQQVYDTYVSRWPSGIPQLPAPTIPALLGSVNYGSIQSITINPYSLNPQTGSLPGLTAFFGYDHLDSVYMESLEKHISLIGLANNMQLLPAPWYYNGDFGGGDFEGSQNYYPLYLRDVHYYGRENIKLFNEPVAPLPTPSGFEQQYRLSYVTLEQSTLSGKTELPVLTPFPTPTVSYDAFGGVYPVGQKMEVPVRANFTKSPLLDFYPSPTPTSSITPTPTPTPTVTPTISLTPTMTVTPTSTPTVTPTISLTPTMTMTPTPSPAAEVLPPLAHRWTFNTDISDDIGARTTTLVDEDPNNSVIFPASIDDKQVIKFRGYDYWNSYLSITPFTGNGQVGHSYSAWVYISPDPEILWNVGQQYVSILNSSSGGDLIQIYANNGIFDSIESSFYDPIAPELLLDKWSMLTYVYDPNFGSKFYIDGVLHGTGDVDSVNYTHIGSAYGYSPSGYYIDNIEYYQSILSDNLVAQLFARDAASYPAPINPPRDGYYEFPQGFYYLAIGFNGGAYYDGGDNIYAQQRVDNFAHENGYGFSADIQNSTKEAFTVPGTLCGPIYISDNIGENVRTTTDGITWSSIALPTQTRLASPGVFVGGYYYYTIIRNAFTSGVREVARTTDHQNFETMYTLPANNVNAEIHALGHDGTNFYMTLKNASFNGNSITQVGYSADAISWTFYNQDSGNSNAATMTGVRRVVPVSGDLVGIIGMYDGAAYDKPMTYITTDYGQTKTVLDNIIGNPALLGSVLKYANIFKWGADLYAIISLFEANGSTVASEGNILRSTDGGTSWTLVAANTGITGAASSAVSNGVFMVAGPASGNYANKVTNSVAAWTTNGTDWTLAPRWHSARLLVAECPP